MSHTLHLTRHWPYEKLAAYNKELTEAARRLAEKFGDDMRLETLAESLARGAADLWLILDERQRFAAFLITETEIAPSGKKRLLALELAGGGGEALCDALPQLEDFARAQGAAELCPYGRAGWGRALRRQGYRQAVVKYAKEL